MDRNRPIRLLWAVALAIALSQFVWIGIGVAVSPGQAPSAWNQWLWPWLSRVLPTVAVVTVAVMTGCLVRRRRPERLAAVMAAVGGFLIFVFPETFGGLHLPIRQIVTFALGGAFPRAVDILAEHLSSVEMNFRLGRILATSWGFVVPVVVASWLGANYWRSGSWRRFWRGPGGAILKGSFLGGAAGILLALPAAWYRYSVMTDMVARLFPGGPSPEFKWALYLARSPHAMADAATITALLAAWRPRSALGAFAGSGLSLATGVVFVALSAWRPDGAALSLADILILQAPSLATGALVGAVAGSFAGRWEVEPTD